MSSHLQMMLDLYKQIGQDPDAFKDAEVSHLVVHHNQVLGSHTVPGLEADVDELEDGVAIRLRVVPGVVIAKPVHMCFGMLPEKGLQKISLDINLEQASSVGILAHCVFPNAVDITHLMDANIKVGDNASYRYMERHIHGKEGGVRLVPRARVHLASQASFDTDFELIRGRVGRIELDYECWCDRDSSLRMTTRIAGRGNDRIKVRETGHLEGPGASGVLLSRIAVRQQAQADIYNKMTASAPRAYGHVDCKEIVQDQAVARATPIVEVRHPLARVTHEAAIGSVDSKQLQTLMARGMPEEDAVELIIQGLLQRH